MALGLNFLIDGSPAVLGFSLALVVDSPGLVALFLQLSEGQFVILLGYLELFAGPAEFKVRQVLLLQYGVHGVVILLQEVGNLGGVGYSRLREFKCVGCKKGVKALCCERLNLRAGIT